MFHLEPRPNPERMPDDFEQRRRQRQCARRRRRLLRALTVGAAALFAAGLIVALGVNFSWIVNRRAQRERERQAFAARPQPPPLAGTGLVLSEARIRSNGDDRRIVGTIRNQSPRAYRDVDLSLMVRSLRGVGLGYARARLARVEPSAEVPFETAALPPEATRFDLYSLTGNPAP